MARAAASQVNGIRPGAVTSLRRRQMDEECRVYSIHKAPSVEERQEQVTVDLTVQGMGCPNCVNRVRNSLLMVYGVVTVEIALEGGATRVMFNPRLATPQDLIDAVAAAGRDGRHNYRAYAIS